MSILGEIWITVTNVHNFNNFVSKVQALISYQTKKLILFNVIQHIYIFYSSKTTVYKISG